MRDKNSVYYIKMNDRVLVLVVVLLVALLELGAISCLKNWSINKNGYFLGGGVILYVIVSLVFAYSLTLHNLPSVNAIWQALSVIIVTLVSIGFFKETPNGWWEWSGIAVVCVGFLLLACGVILKPEK